ncbi:MAG: DMT family transporter [Acidobacteriaceae bacterium]|nr:DMT family transporter [Acidobacteriaceae bacterium]
MPAIDIRAQDAGKSLPKGIGLIVLAFLCAASYGALSKGLHDVSPLLTLAFQYLVSFLCFLPSGLRLGLSALKTQRAGLQVFRSLVGSACQLLYFLSLRTLPLLAASLLSNAAPLFIPIVVWLWLRKGISKTVTLSLVIGLLGVLLVIHPGPDLLHDPSALLALGSGILSAVSLVTTNQLAETDPPSRTLIYNFGISSVLLLPILFIKWQPLNGRQWLLLVGVGIFYALTQWFIILAYRYASASELSPFNYSVVVFSGLLGWIFYGNVPTLEAITGTVLICGGGILSISAGHKEGRGHWLGSGHWHWPWKRKNTAEKKTVPA